jgi:hypothetical protein
VTALVACETVLLVLLTMLVAGLLRSHAEILRRLGPGGDGEGDAPRAAAAPPRDDEAAPDVAGVTLAGDAAKLALGAPGAPDTLLAFLSTGCETCKGFFSTFAEGAPLPHDIRLVVVTKDTSRESPSRLRELAGDLPLVMSSAAWSDYRVPGSPYFVLARGGRIAGEGSASEWAQLASLLRDAFDDLDAFGSDGEARALRADRALRSAGIGPGDPSLYPGGDER